jgi:hypothetical protein
MGQLHASMAGLQARKNAMRIHTAVRRESFSLAVPLYEQDSERIVVRKEFDEQCVT